MSEGHNKPRWFQFTIRRTLLATFWAAIFASAWVLNVRVFRHDIDIVVSGNEILDLLVMHSLLIVSMSAAIGALLGRQVTGIFVGVGFSLAWIAWNLAILAFVPI